MDCLVLSLIFWQTKAAIINAFSTVYGAQLSFPVLREKKEIRQRVGSWWGWGKLLGADGRASSTLRCEREAGGRRETPSLEGQDQSPDPSNEDDISDGRQATLQSVNVIRTCGFKSLKCSISEALKKVSPPDKKTVRYQHESLTSRWVSSSETIFDVGFELSWENSTISLYLSYAIAVNTRAQVRMQLVPTTE